MSPRLHATILAVCLWASTSVPLSAQGRDAADAVAARALYVRSVARVFGIPPSEADLLTDWLRHPSELPVLLYVADRGGVPPDIVGSLRRSGASWQRVTTKLGLGPGIFHVEIGGADVAGVLARPVAEFARRPPAEWYLLALTDMEIVALVNVRVLAQAASVSASSMAVSLSAPAPDYLLAYAAAVRARAGAGGPGGR